jgi:hypothetical protein
MKVFQRVTPTDNAAALARALETVAADLAAARARVGGLEAARGAALLDGGETARRAEADLAEARPEAERAEAMRAELERRHAAAEKRERRAAMVAKVAAVEAQCAAAAEAIRRKWPKVGAELLALLEGEAKAEARIFFLNQAFLADPEAAEGLTLPESVKPRYLRPSADAASVPAPPLFLSVTIPPPHLGWTVDTCTAWSPGKGAATAGAAE